MATEGTPPITYLEPHCLACFRAFSWSPLDTLIPRRLPCGHVMCVSCLASWQRCPSRGCPPPHVHLEMCPEVPEPVAAAPSAPVVGVQAVLEELLTMVQGALREPGLTEGSSQFEDLRGILERARAPHILGVLGDTGAGKSTLINALLDEDELLPSGEEGTACTAVPMALKYSSDASYHIELQLTTPGQLKAEVYRLVSRVLAEVDEAAERPTHAILAPLRRLLGDTAGGDEGTELLAGVDWGLEDAEELASSIMGLAQDAQVALGNETVSLQDLLNRGTWACDLEERDDVKRLLDESLKVGEQLELVLRRITVSHAWPLLRRGLVLMDLPGVADAERSRGNVATQALAEASSVMVAAKIGRFLANETAQHYIDEVVGGEAGRNTGLAAQLQTDGYFAHILVATCADIVPPTDRGLIAYRRNLDAALFEQAGVDQAAYLRLCDAADRRQMSPGQRNELRRMYARLRQASVVQRTFHSVQAAMGRQNRMLRTHAVSAVDYTRIQQGDLDGRVFTDEEETGLVGLKDQLERLPDQHKKGLVSAAANTLLNILALMTEEAGEGPSDFEAAFTAASERLEQRLDAAKTELVARSDELRLNNVLGALNLEAGLQAAQRQLQDILGGLRWKTLAMLCRNNGRCGGRSRALSTNYNLNLILAQPIIDSVIAVWGATYGVDGALFTEALEPWRASLLASFDEAVNQVQQRLEAGDGAQDRLPGQAGAWQQVRDLVRARSNAAMEELYNVCNNLTRGIVPAIVDAIEAGLSAAYEQNRNDSGTGLQRRMHDRLTSRLASPVILENIHRAVSGRLDRLGTSVAAHAQMLVELLGQQFALASVQRGSAREDSRVCADERMRRIRQELLPGLEGDE